MKVFEKKCTLCLFFVFFLLIYSPIGWTKTNSSVALSGESALQLLIKNNIKFQQSQSNPADISLQSRKSTTEDGQKPYAIIVTCADSRVPPEHIFSAGIGEIFVIRNAGNVIGKHEIGSIEYAVKHLHVKLIVVLGHTHCGAVKAALSPSQKVQSSHLFYLVQDIHKGLQGQKDPRKAEKRNIENSVQNILSDPVLAKAIKENNVLVQGALYFIESGAVNFFSPNTLGNTD